MTDFRKGERVRMIETYYPFYEKGDKGVVVKNNPHNVDSLVRVLFFSSGVSLVVIKTCCERLSKVGLIWIRKWF